MAVVYPTALKTTRMQAVRDAIDAGAGPGKLEIGTAAMALVLATVTLADPASSVAGDVLTLLGVPLSDTDADATGTAAAARIRTSADADVVTNLTVGLAGANIIVDDIEFTAGQTITITAGTITHG